MTNIGIRSEQAAGRLTCAAVIAVGCLLVGCTTPRIIRADLQIFRKSELGFLTVGETPREQVLVAMGNPSSRFESDRILIYQVRFNDDGKVEYFAPKSIGSSGFREWEPGTSSIVLVFDPDGILLKIGLVESK